MSQIIFKNFLIFLFVLSGCAKLDKKVKLSNQGYYKKALSLKKNKNYSSALKMLELLNEKNLTANTFLSQLLEADIYYKQKDYVKALKTYAKLQKVYPQLKSDKVLFRMGSCHLQKTPSRADTDLFEADQALSYFKRVLNLPFKSSYKRKARAKIDFLLNLKAEKELKIAVFYKKRNQNQAAFFRLKGLLKDYPKSALVPKALLLSYTISKIIKKPSLKFKKRLLKEFPKSKEAIKLKSEKGKK